MTEQAKCQGSGPDDDMMLELIEKHREHNKQASSAHSESTFTNQMIGATNRQGILLDALHSATKFSHYFNLEDVDSESLVFNATEMDFYGIDSVVVYEDGSFDTVAFKTRSPHKRDFEDLDLGLRVTGRKGSYSHEWDKFADEDRIVPDYMVYGLFHPLPGEPLPGEVMVLDYKKLKEEYHNGRISVSPEIKMSSKNDSGSARYLDATDLRNSNSLEWHRQYWSDQIECKGPSRNRRYSEIDLEFLERQGVDVGLFRDSSDEQDEEENDSSDTESTGLDTEAVFNSVRMLNINYELNTIVEDVENNDSLVVVGKHEDKAGDVTLPNSNTSLAEYNSCPEDDDVYACVYLDKAVQALKESHVDWGYENLEEAFDSNHGVVYQVAGASVGIDDPDWLETELESYYFPDSRLSRIEALNETDYLDKVERQARKAGDVFERIPVALRYDSDEPCEQIVEEYNVVKVDCGSTTLLVHGEAESVF